MRKSIEQMNRNLFILAAWLLFSLLFSGCEKDRELQPWAADELELVLDFPAAETRVVTDENGRGYFTDGDQVGLWVSGSSVRFFRLTLQDGHWLPKLKRSDLPEGDVTFTAAYPAPEQMTEGERIPFVIEPDQGGDGYGLSDGLLATAKGADVGSDGVVHLTFGHALHRMVIELKAKEGELPAGLSVEVKTLTECDYDLSAGTMVETGGTAVWVKAKQLDNGRFAAVVMPQRLTEGADLVRVSADGKSACFKAPARIGTSEQLAAGASSLLQLTVTQSGTVEPEPDMDFRNRKVWVYGINTEKAPAFEPELAVPYRPGTDWMKFEKGKWGRITYDYGGGDIEHEDWLTYDTDMGWYDCNKWKVDGVNQDADRNLCWAATASNLIHWWIMMNKPYVEAYEAEYAPLPDQPARPSEVFSPETRSEIYNLYKHYFKDVSGWPSDGANWFFNARGGGVYQDYNYGIKFKGYYSEVFKDKLSVSYNTPDKETFNRVLKEALQAKQAFGFAVAYGSGLNHAMTLWGAEFDENGDASYVYYCDNEDMCREPRQGSVIRKKISYFGKGEEGEGVRLGTSPRNPKIRALMTLDLGRKVWREKYPWVVVDDGI